MLFVCLLSVVCWLLSVVRTGPKVVDNNSYLNKYWSYSLCQKKHTFNLEFFLWPPWGRGAKNSYGRLCKLEFYHLHNRSCAFLAPLPQGGHKKIQD